MNRPSSTAVQVARLDDASVVGSILAAALTDTAVGAVLAPGRAARKQLLHRVFAALAAEAVNHGIVHLRSDAAGAAIWLPAGVATTVSVRTPQDADIDLAVVDTVFSRALAALDPVRPAPGPSVLSDAGGTVLAALATVLRPAVRAGDLTRLLPPAVPSREHPPRPGAAFLLALGVDPNSRHDGVARKLLAQQHVTLDASHAPAVAVAIDPAGQQLYTTAGYQPHHVDPIVAGLAVQWLVRPPNSATTSRMVGLVTPRTGWTGA
ncbi:hypothetical protein ABZS66_28195 [Dactylosporangium sp. NPDC005572]|uniref:hypothetical protein n=1 Tax=Dactylosporangium sp. NPDC005572 TaxID=3156889 RepID=UPI0033A9DB58